MGELGGGDRRAASMRVRKVVPFKMVFSIIRRYHLTQRNACDPRRHCIELVKAPFRNCIKP